MNALERIGNAVGGALASVAATLGGGDSQPPPRPVPSIVMPQTMPVPTPRPDFEVAALAAPGAAPSAAEAGANGASSLAAPPSTGAPAVTMPGDELAAAGVAPVAPSVPVTPPDASAEATVLAALGVPFPPRRPSDLAGAPAEAAPGGATPGGAVPAMVEEGDASPPGGDVAGAELAPAMAGEPTMPGEPTPSAALMGDAGGVLAPAVPAAPAASVQQFAFAPPASPADAVPFGAVVGMTPSAPGSEPSAATGPGTTLAPPSPVAAAAPPPVLPPGADHRGGLGGNNAAAGDADLGAVVVPTPRPVILEASELPLGAVVVSIPPPRPEPGADAPGGPSYVVIQAPPTQLAALEPRVTTPALIARLNNDPPNPACIARLRELGVEFEILDPIATDTGCGTSQPLRVRALHNGAVQLNPPATLDCGMAETLVAWVDGEVQPAALAEFEARVTGLQVAASYSCRGVNGARSGPLSEHAYANALDVSAFEIGEETKVAVLASEEPDAPGAMFLSEIRTGACDHFHTVLGPGSDSAHWNHFHLDLAPRGRNGDSRFCQ